jgi:hypothetical protein
MEMFSDTLINVLNALGIYGLFTLLAVGFGYCIHRATRR